MFSFIKITIQCSNIVYSIKVTRIRSKTPNILQTCCINTILLPSWLSLITITIISAFHDFKHCSQRRIGWIPYFTVDSIVGYPPLHYSASMKCNGRKYCGCRRCVDSSQCRWGYFSHIRRHLSFRWKIYNIDTSFQTLLIRLWNLKHIPIKMNIAP